MFENSLSRFAPGFRLAGITVIGAGLALSIYAFSIAEGPVSRYWGLAAGLAGFTVLGLLILAAPEHIAGVRQYLSPRFIVGAGFLHPGLRRTRSLARYSTGKHTDMGASFRDWRLGNFAWLLVVLGLRALDRRTRDAGILVGSVVIICSLAEALYRADNAFLYPAHQFLQTALFNATLGLVVIVAAVRPWNEHNSPGGVFFSLAFAALGLIYIGDVIWWSQAADFSVRSDIAVRIVAGYLPVCLIGLVIAGTLRTRFVIAASALITVATVSSSILMLDAHTENQLFFFVSSVLIPVAGTILAVALSFALESNQGDVAETAELEPEGDFGPPLPAWR